MDFGAHIPVYVFCEPLIAEERVLDVYPADGQGARFLAESARSVTVVQPPGGRRLAGGDGISGVVAATDALPFARDSFDFIVFHARGEHASPGAVDDFLRAARSLISHTGLLALTIPNKDAVLLDGKPDTPLPGYFDLERSLRRHFPHVTIFAQRPLNGAMITPLGKGDGASAPLLDDRLLPSAGETPSHFLALCSPRYRRVDDTMIAQVPYELLLGEVREQIDRLEARVAVAISESEARSREIDRMTQRIEDLVEQVGEAEILKGERVSALSRLHDAETQIRTREEMLSVAEQARESLARRLGDAEQENLDLKQKLQNLDHRVLEAEQQTALATREREEIDKDNERTLEALRSARAETRSKQRELDDAREEIAGFETEAHSLREEFQRQRAEALAARENASRLEMELKKLEDMNAETRSLENELERVRSLAASERERLEGRLAEEHGRLLEEMAAHTRTEHQAAENEKLLEELRAEGEAASRRNEALEARVTQLAQERDFLERDRREAQRASDEMARLARDGADEVERHKHQLELLTERAAQSEARAALLSDQLAELNAGLEKTEDELAALRKAKKLADRRAEKLEAAVAEQEKKAESAEQQRAILEAQVEELEEELAATSSTAAHGEEMYRSEAKRANEAELREREARDQIVVLEETIDEARVEAQRVEDELTRVREDHETAKDEIARLQLSLEEAGDAHTEAHAARQKIDRLEAELGDEAATRAEVEKNLEETRAELQRLAGALEQWTGTAGDLERRLEEERARREELERALEEARSQGDTRAGELEAALGEARSRADKFAAEIDEAVRQRDELEERLAAITTARDGLLEQIKAKESSAEQLERGAKEAVAKLEAERNSLTQELKKEQLELAKAQRELGRVQKRTGGSAQERQQLEKARKEIERLKEKLKETGKTRTELQKATRENETLRQATDDALVDIEKLEEALAGAKEEIARLEAAGGGGAPALDDLARAKQEIADLKEARLEAERTHAELEKASGQLAELEEARTDARRAQAELARAREEIGRLEKQLDASGAEIDPELARSIAEAEEERQAMEEQMRKLISEMERELLTVSGDVERELRAANARADKAEGEVWELREEVLRLRAQVAATTAATEKDGKDAALLKALTEQEAKVASVSEERNQLRESVRKLKRALEKSQGGPGRSH
jgi:chromosome segregation ATPase